MHRHSRARSFQRIFAPGFGRPAGGADDVLARLFGGLWIVIVKEHWRQGAPHVPFDIISQHAQKHVRPHPVCEVVIDGTDLQVHALHTPERALDIG